jgi:molybdenum cofactor biosynthesis protein B
MSHQTQVEQASVAVLTVSDSRSRASDRSGDIIVEHLEQHGHVAASRLIVADDAPAITEIVKAWSDDSNVDAIIVTGGTGPSRRDVTVDAVSPLMSATLPGFGELFRHRSYEEIGPAAMLSRASAGWCDGKGGRTPIFLLPGSPAAVELAMGQLIMSQLGHLLAVCASEKAS